MNAPGAGDPLSVGREGDPLLDELGERLRRLPDAPLERQAEELEDVHRTLVAELDGLAGAAGPQDDGATAPGRGASAAGDGASTPGDGARAPGGAPRGAAS